MFIGAVAKNNEWFVYIYLKKKPKRTAMIILTQAV